MSTNPYVLIGDLDRTAHELRLAADGWVKREAELNARVLEREERIRQLETDLRIAQTAHLAAEELLGQVRENDQRLRDEVDELQGRLREYEGGEMQIGPESQEAFDRLDQMVNSELGAPDSYSLPEQRSDIQDLLSAVANLDNIGRWREQRSHAEVLKVENATRRADTAERLMREAQAKVRELEETVQKDSLLDVILRMNEATTRTTEALAGAGSGIKAGAEVRRQMAVKYSLEHDAEHGEEMFIDAATALLRGDRMYWPGQFSAATFHRLADRPQVARAHAIALIAVAYDISRKEQDDAAL